MNDDTRLSDVEIERYARHIVLPEIGGEGQQKLKAAKVCVVGAGGLGSPALLYLASAGVGTLAVIDDDVVSLSNLQRQIIHASPDVGQKKVDSAEKSIDAINPHVTVKKHAVHLSEGNAADILSSYDIIVDGSDNFDTRYLVADTAEALCLPLVAGALGRFDGSLSVFVPHESDNPRYRDLFPTPPPPGSISSCAQAGVLGAVAGVIGTLQAVEVIKLITNVGNPLIGELLLYNALDASFSKVRYARRP